MLVGYQRSFCWYKCLGTSNPHIDDVSVAEPPTYPIAELSTGVINFGDVFVGVSKVLTLLLLIPAAVI